AEHGITETARRIMAALDNMAKNALVSLHGHSAVAASH
ncbi:hypothetical protein HaLaN_31387, partial [Haematococcus lacustris]